MKIRRREGKDKVKKVEEKKKMKRKYPWVKLKQRRAKERTI